MANLIFVSTTGIQDVIYSTFWEVRPPPKRKKEVRTDKGPQHWNAGHSSIKKQIKKDWYTVTAHTSSRDSSGRTVLRREQREPLQNNHYQDWTAEKHQEQHEINCREDWTTYTSRRNVLLYSVRPFRTNSHKEGAMWRFTEGRRY
jgi:hypothetical protein